MDVSLITLECRSGAYLTHPWSKIRFSLDIYSIPTEHIRKNESLAPGLNLILVALSFLIVTVPDVHTGKFLGTFLRKFRRNFEDQRRMA